MSKDLLESWAHWPTTRQTIPSGEDPANPSGWQDNLNRIAELLNKKLQEPTGTIPDGSLLYYDTASEEWKALGPGTAGQVLKVTGGKPAWGTVAATAADVGAVAKSGDTMTGALVLAADPAAPMQAATQQYVDNKRFLYMGDETAVSAAGTTATTVKSIRVIKSASAGANISKLFILGTLKVSSGTGYLDVFVDNVLTSTLPTTTSTSAYVLVKSGAIAVTWTDDSIHTIDIKLRNSGSGTTYNDLLELYVS